MVLAISEFGESYDYDVQRSWQQLSNYQTDDAGDSLSWVSTPIIRPRLSPKLAKYLHRV